MTDDTAPDDAPDGDTDADRPGYQDALGELDEILRELEGADVDVDRLADRVTRASELIALCRDRISTARVQIQRVTADLDAGVAVDDR